MHRCRSTRLPSPEVATRVPVPAQERVGLDDDQTLVPGAEAAGHQHKERPVGLGAARALDASLQDDRLLPQERVLQYECGLDPRQISQRAGDEWHDRRLGRGRKVATHSVDCAACGGGNPVEEVSEHGGAPERVYWGAAQIGCALSLQGSWLPADACTDVLIS